MILALLCASCASVDKLTATPVAAAAAAGDAFVSCAKADITQLLPEIGISLLADVVGLLSSAPTDYEAQLDQLGGKVGGDALACSVLAVETVLHPKDGGTQLTPTVARARGYLASRKIKFAPTPARSPAK